MRVWWGDRDADEDEAERMTATLAPWCRERLRLLAQIDMTQQDRGLVEGLARRADAELTAERRHWIRQLLWRWRRALDPSIRPKVNPDDPIVRAMEEAGV